MLLYSSDHIYFKVNLRQVNNSKKFELFQNELQIDQIQDDFEEKGRDCAHNGHLSQDLVVDKILEKIKNGIS